MISRDDTADAVKSSSERTGSSGFLKDVIRRQWHSAITGTDKARSHATAEELDNHIASMNALVDPLDYEIYCIPNIVSHSKHMQAEELTRFLKQIEAFAVGYSSMLGKEVTGLLLIGLTSKARSTKSIEKYQKLLYDDIDTRMVSYSARIEKRGRKLARLSGRVTVHKKSLFRFFMGRRIIKLSRAIDREAMRIDTLKKKHQRLDGIKREMKIRAAKPSPPPPPRS